MRKSVVLVLAVALLAGGVWLYLETGDNPRPPRRSAGNTPGTTDNERDGAVKDGVTGGGFLKKACSLPARWVKLIYRGWTPGTTRTYDLAVVPAPPNYMGTFTDTSHSGPYDFLQEVPLMLYGPGFIKPAGHVSIDREVTVADIAPTVAELIDFDFPARKGGALSEVLEDTDERPRLIVTAVIDGGGWNVLQEHPESWPNLKRLMEEGTNIDNALVGSSPSITPAIHTNIGTGSFPRQHGVTAILVRKNDGRIVSGFGKARNSSVRTVDPTINLRQTTLADEYDLAVNNAAEVALVSPSGYQLGMIGSGASISGADADIASLYAKKSGIWTTNLKYFKAPGYINEHVAGPAADKVALDRSDGEADGLWRGHEMSDLVATPALAAWENRIIKEIIERERFGKDAVTDLLSINYKAPDAAGHLYNMTSPEVAQTLESVDSALDDLIDYLDAQVGAGRYVVIATADHGQTPLEAGGWPIGRTEIKADIEARFDDKDNDVTIMEGTSASSFFMRKQEMKANGVTPERVASFLSDYTIGDNIRTGDEVPRDYEGRLDETVFDAVIPGRKISRVARCTGAVD